MAIVRDRVCMDCGHQWTADVKVGSAVTLSGEHRVWCPKCNSGAILSEPQYDTGTPLCVKPIKPFLVFYPSGMCDNVWIHHLSFIYFHGALEDDAYADNRFFGSDEAPDLVCTNTPIPLLAVGTKATFAGVYRSDGPQGTPVTAYIWRTKDMPFNKGLIVRNDDLTANKYAQKKMGELSPFL